MRNRICIIFLLFQLATLPICEKVFAKTLEAKTSLTVVNVTQWDNPSCLEYVRRDDVLKSVSIKKEMTLFSWNSPWPIDIPKLNDATGRIWAIQCDQNNGKSCRAIAWDWIGNNTTSKENDYPYASNWVGIMLSTVCGTERIPPYPHKTCTNQKVPERSNIMFSTNPFSMVPLLH